MQQFSTYSGIWMHTPIEERICAIAEAGFDAVCLDFEKELAKTETSWENQMMLAQKYKLPVENVHLTGVNMTSVWTDSDEGDTVIARLIEELRGIASLGIPVGVAHVTWGHSRPAGHRELGLRRYVRAAEAAEKYGVKLALENSVYPEYVRFLLDNLHSPAVGFCFDSGHECAFSPEENYLDSYADRLFAMHLHDNNGKDDQHSIPLTGKVEWNRVLSQLKRAPLFQNTLTLECHASDRNLREDLHAALEAAETLCRMAE